MINHDTARSGGRVRVTAPREPRDHPPLTGDHIHRTPGLAAFESDLTPHRFSRGGIRRQIDPVHDGLAQKKPPPRRDCDKGDRAFLAVDAVFDHRLVVALRTQQGFGRFSGSSGPSASFEAVGRSLVHIADRRLDLGPQLAVDISSDLGARIGASDARQADDDRQGRGKVQNASRQDRTWGGGAEEPVGPTRIGNMRSGL